MMKIVVLSTLMAQALVGKVGALEEGSTPHNLVNEGDSSEELLTLADMQLHMGEKEAARRAYLDFAQRWPESERAGEALFWASRATSDEEEARRLLVQVYTLYPGCCYAAEAYFDCFPDADYLFGKQQAVAHLESMAQRFPRSPYLVNAYYLLGLDSKRNHPSVDGRCVCPADLNKAMAYFREATATYERLRQEGAIPDEQMAYFRHLRFRAELERGLVNVAVAMQTQGVKHDIYLQYAIAIFKDIVAELKNNQMAELQEVQYHLAAAYLALGNVAMAETTASAIIKGDEEAKITRSYFLSKAWMVRGIVAAKNGQVQEALKALDQAEDAAKARLLSTDERLELWILRSDYLRQQGRLDEAMSVLSQVVNDQTISALRLKAMYLRAEIYEEEGKSELASKQLIAIANQSGEWALKARKKLEESYGHQSF